MVEYLSLLRKYGNKTMFKIFHGEKSEIISYNDYLKDLRICAYNIESVSGDLKGKHIGIIASSGYEYLVLLGAVIFAKAVAVPINELESEENISFAVRNSDIELLIVEGDCEKYSYENVIIKEKGWFLIDHGNEKELRDFSVEEENDLAIIIYTSGTTSLSKGVALSAKNLFYNIENILPEYYILNRGETVGARVYTNFPFYHIGGILLWLSWSLNGCITCLSADPKAILDDLEKNSIDFAGVTPATFKLWINCLKRGKKERLGGVRHVLSGGAALEPDLIKEFLSNGITVGQFYGQTEIGGVITSNYDMQGHINSLGKAAEQAIGTVK